MSALRIDVADLLNRPGARRPVHLDAVVDGLGTRAASIDGPVALDLVLERVPNAVVARGVVHAHWQGDCGTCLHPLRGDLDVTVGELFEHRPVDGETYLLDGHELDLELLVRDAVLLELPLAPSCATVGRAPCAPETLSVVGPDAGPPEAERVADPRWAALSQLEL